MADLTATSPMAIAMTSLRSILGASSDYQSWCGAASESAALAKVLIGGSADSEAPDEPFVCIFGGDVNYEEIGVNTFGVSGTLKVNAFITVADAYATDFRNATVYVENMHGDLAKLIADCSGQAVGTTRYYFHSITTSMAPQFVNESLHEDNQERFDGAVSELTLDWGIS